MDSTLQGIVLHLSKYSDRASILHLFTQEHGRMALMVYGLHGKQGKVRAALFEPLARIEVIVSGSSAGKMPTVKEAHLVQVANQTRTDMCRRAVALFMAEILFRSLTFPMTDETLFLWLEEQLLEVETNPHPENLHLIFLLQLAEHLGIMPDLSEPSDSFSLQETILLQQVLDNASFSLSRTARQSLLEKLCRYYELHITDFQQPASLAVLEAVFD